jgi:hypothetical protein
MSFSLRTPVPEHVLVTSGKFRELSERNLVINLYYFGKFLTAILFITRQIFYKVHDMHVYKGNFFDMNIRIIGNCDSEELS